MKRSQLPFKLTDVRRAVRAAQTAGIAVGRVEIDKAGKISLVVSNPSAATDTDDDGSEWK